MTILSLEFSSPRRSVALWRNRLMAEAVEHSGGRGTKAFGLIAEVLARGRVSRKEIEVIAVGLGPGSYTGIRTAIALAQGWQLASGIKLLGVSSVASLAAQAQTENIFGRVNLAVDAQRGEFYVAVWEISRRGCTELSPLQIVSAAELAERKSAGQICVGPDMERALFPTAATVAMLAAEKTDFLPGNHLEPIYLRETAFVKAPAARTAASQK